MSATSKAEEPPTKTGGDAALFTAITVVSLVAVAIIAYVLFGTRPAPADGSLTFMPALNATLNALAATLQVAGLLAIKARRRDLHRGLMLGALGASALFLVGYLVYHYVHGDTPYPQDAPYRGVYLAVLLTHVVGSILVVPMILLTFARALQERFDKHRKVAKVTLPLWLYVSVTGILVFVMLRAATG